MIKEEGHINVEDLIMLNLEEIIADYDQRIFKSLQKKEYALCEELLSNFCFEILDMSEDEQVFVARIFFISLVTDIIRIQTRKKMFHPRMLSYSYKVIAQIERWHNLSEYLLSITWFVEQLRENILIDYVISDGCSHVEDTLSLIHTHLKGDILTVKWLAAQIGISTTHLSNVFKLQTGENLSNYIMKRKMNEIVFEMTYTNQSLKVIREKYGFTNHSYFIQCFKKYKGVTPLKYKQALHK